MRPLPQPTVTCSKSPMETTEQYVNVLVADVDFLSLKHVRVQSRGNFTDFYQYSISKYLNY